jgi:putative flippase GtrA
MANKLQSLLRAQTQRHIVRYFIMAAFVVCIELLVFALINTGLGITYLIATPVSMAVSFVLNWYFSKVYVFNGSRHKAHVEFSLVLVTSLVGVGIQLVVTGFCINKLHLLPIIGKFFAIIITFFWNFWVRKRYIFTVDTF